jgi:hypothetical protein
MLRVNNATRFNLASEAVAHVAAMQPDHPISTRSHVLRRRRALLFIAVNRESRSTDVALARKQERCDFLGVAVEVDQDGLVSREECIEWKSRTRSLLLPPFSAPRAFECVSSTSST